MGSSLTPAGSTRRWRAIRAQVVAEQPACHWCGAPSTCADHVIPRRFGGSDARDNLVGACEPCNLARGAAVVQSVPSRAW